jgi:hypothetical protein
MLLLGQDTSGPNPFRVSSGKNEIVLPIYFSLKCRAFDLCLGSYTRDIMGQHIHQRTSQYSCTLTP